MPEFVGVTKPNEFTRFDGSIVPSGITYHIKYDGEAKTELYLTGERFTDESIGLVRIKGESSFGQYKRLKGKLVNQQYFEPYVFEPKKKDFKRGFAYRFFARKRFGNKDVMEISETDFKKESVMYDVVETRWFVGDNKYEIQIQNPILVEELVEKGFIELEDLNIMEGLIVDFQYPITVILGEITNINSAVVGRQIVDRGENTPVKRPYASRDIGASCISWYGSTDLNDSENIWVDVCCSVHAVGVTCGR